MQSVLFLLAGFDTTATTLTNTIFLLSRNSEVQDKLYEEIMRKHEDFVRLLLDKLYAVKIYGIGENYNSQGRSQTRNDS